MWALRDLGCGGIEFVRVGGETDDDGLNRRAWLYEVLLDAADRELATLQERAGDVMQLGWPAPSDEAAR
jgi:hypothetical protein